MNHMSQYRRPWLQLSLLVVMMAFSASYVGSPVALASPGSSASELTTLGSSSGGGPSTTGLSATMADCQDARLRAEQMRQKAIETRELANYARLQANTAAEYYAQARYGPSRVMEAYWGAMAAELAGRANELEALAGMEAPEANRLAYEANAVCAGRPVGSTDRYHVTALA